MTRVALVLLLALVAQGTAQETRTRALLVGCTEYPNLKGHRYYRTSIRLLGPANDVALLKKMFRERLGVAATDMTTLTGWPKEPDRRPTRQNIIAQLDRLAHETAKGERVILYFAGHGTQLPDDDGDELDGLDEVFLPADITRWLRKGRGIPEAIRDDELGEKVRAIRDRGATVWLIMDCCHAGTMVRGSGEGRRRSLEPSLLGAPAVKQVAGAAVRFSPEQLKDVVATYASQSFRTALEVELPPRDPAAKWHGVLSFSLAAQLRLTGGNLTFRELQDRLVNAYQIYNCAGTVPVVEGDLDLMVHGSGKGAEAPLLLRMEKDNLVLNAGRLAGLEKGALLSVYRPGSRGRSDARLGLVRVVQAGLVDAVCKPEGKLPALKGDLAVCPARLESAAMGDYRLRIFPTAVQPEIVEALKTGAPTILRAVRRGESDWILDARPGGGFALRGRLAADGEILPVRQGGLSVALRRLFRSQNLRRFAAGNLLPDGLEVRLLKEGKPVRNGALLRPGEVTEIEIRNATRSRYDLTILMLDSTGGLACLYPGYGLARLDHVDKKPLRLGPYDMTDESLGTEHLIVLAVPRAEDAPQVDLGWLAQGKVAQRGAEKSPAGRFLEALAYGSGRRGPSYQPDTVHGSLITWRTTWGEIAPPRKFPVEPAPLPATRARGESGRPDPWALGPMVSLARTDPDGKVDMLLAGSTRPAQVLIDLDGDSGIADSSPATAVRRAMARKLDWEIGLHFAPDRRTAFYDTDNDGQCDLILVDHDEDDRADTRYTLEDKTWRVERDVDAIWMSAAYLKFKNGEDLALKKLKVVTR